MTDLINYRIRLSTIDNRTYIGTLLAFDKHLNLVLSDTVESRITKKSIAELKKSPNPTEITPVLDKRNLGLIIIRGDQIVSLVIESAPLTSVSSRIADGNKGTGTSRPLKTPVSVKGKFKKIA